MAVMGGIIGKIMTAAAKDEMDIYGKVTNMLFYSGKKKSPIKQILFDDKKILVVNFADFRMNCDQNNQLMIRGRLELLRRKCLPQSGPLSLLADKKRRCCVLRKSLVQFFTVLFPH